MSATPERSVSDSCDQPHACPPSLQAPPGDPIFLTLDQVAGKAGLSRKTILAEIRAGNLRYVMIGKRKRFTAEDLSEFKERKRASCPSVNAPTRHGSGTTSRSKAIG